MVRNCLLFCGDTFTFHHFQFCYADIEQYCLFTMQGQDGRLLLFLSSSGAAAVCSRLTGLDDRGPGVFVRKKCFSACYPYFLRIAFSPSSVRVCAGDDSLTYSSIFSMCLDSPMLQFLMFTGFDIAHAHGHLPLPFPLSSYYAFIVCLLGHTAVRTSVA